MSGDRRSSRDPLKAAAVYAAAASVLTYAVLIELLDPIVRDSWPYISWATISIYIGLIYWIYSHLVQRNIPVPPAVVAFVGVSTGILILLIATGSFYIPRDPFTDGLSSNYQFAVRSVDRSNPLGLLQLSVLVLPVLATVVVAADPRAVLRLGRYTWGRLVAFRDHIVEISEANRGQGFSWLSDEAGRLGQRLREVTARGTKESRWDADPESPSEPDADVSASTTDLSIGSWVALAKDLPPEAFVTGRTA